jgi:electron transfer flavoprotein alpha subunit
LKNPSSEFISSVISHLHRQYNYESIIGPSNNYGKNILPRVGGLLDVQPISDVVKIESKTKFSRLFYAGNAICTIETSQKPNIMTIRLTSFDKTLEAENQAEVVKLVSQIDFSAIKSTSFKENIVSKTDKVELTSAKVVISGGRSLKSAENFKMLDELATCFDSAAIGASRAAVDAGYVPNDLQIGQTGKVVAPEIYFAIGISGAIQHVAGMKDSKVIVAVNSDGDCPIFQVI